MKKGETDNIVIPPEEGYGPRSDDRVRSFSSIRLFPKKTIISPEKFHELFKAEPVKGNPVHLVSYFNHRIVEINKKEIVLEAEIKDSISLKSEIGDTMITPEENNIALTLQPRLGADFSAGNEKGKIVSINEKSFTVDFNHPLAGKNLFLELAVDSVIKASTVENWKIPWQEDHDKGLAIAEKSGKPVALILYKDGCQWCEKLFKTTMKDPRVEYFENEFIWIKVNGKEHPEFMDIYKTDSYPSILLLDSRGQVIEKMLGFKYAYVLRDNLSSALQKMEKATTFTFTDEDPARHQLTIN
jgi:FKBP-type peptidyl-prolyl cis-trans isomerase 2